MAFEVHVELVPSPPISQQTLSGSTALEVFLDHYPLAQLLESSAPSDPHVASSTCQLLHNLTLSFSPLLHSKLQPLKDLGELLLLRSMSTCVLCCFALLFV